MEMTIEANFIGSLEKKFELDSEEVESIKSASSKEELDKVLKSIAVEAAWYFKSDGETDIEYITWIVEEDGEIVDETLYLDI